MHWRNDERYVTVTWGCPRCGREGYEVAVLMQTDDYPHRVGCVEVSSGPTVCECGYIMEDETLVAMGDLVLDGYDPREARADAEED